MTETVAFWARPPQSRELTIVSAIGATLFGVAMLAPWAFAALDLGISALFFAGPRNFLLQQSAFWSGVREVFFDLFTAWYLIVGAVALFALRTGRSIGRWNRDQWLYLALGSILGPWLLVNVLLKEYWGRWRPSFVAEFGGREAFLPPLDWSGSCSSNCAFVSGEVASMVMLFVGAALVSTVWRPVFYAAAVVFGATIAFIRIGQGGHFLSDTLAAAGLMTLLAIGLLIALRRFGYDL